MSKLFWILFAISFQLQAGEPTSVIPEKREFPLSTKVNPCDDFHKYVCAEAEASFKLRPDRSRHTFSFSDSAERLLEAKKSFFAKIAEEKKLNTRGKQIKDQYLACMNEKDGSKIEQQELKKLIADMAKIKSAAQFANYQVAKLNTGEATFFNFDAYSNQDNPKINDMYIMLELMNLPEHSYYENKELMSEYRNLVIEFFKLTDPKMSEADLFKRADRMIDFEKSFVKIYPLPEVRRQRWSEKRQEKQDDFLKKYSNLEIGNFLKRTPKSSLISNSIPEALEFYNKSLTSDNLDVLKDFFLYSMGSPILDDSNSKYYELQFKFNNKYLGGPVARSDRPERCTKKVMRSFVKELDQLLVSKLFPNFPAEKFKAVAAKIRESIVTGLKSNTWLEAETKAKAVLKMEKAKLYLVMPENEKEWDFMPVTKYTSNDRFENARRYNVAYMQKKLKSLKEGANLVAWEMGPLTVNAYYDPSANKFVMPMGILQYPFFNPEGDLIENLGAVGAVIGHELGHGVDDQGSRYDEEGKLKQWMSMNDLKKFSDRSRKLVEQFNKAGHNGTLTLGENIGDLVGLTFAYNAAFPEGKATVEDQKRLFIAYGRLWCGVALPKAEEEQLKTDPHALGWARINEQVKHQKAFAEAFSCKKGDKMVLPEQDQVKIW